MLGFFPLGEGSVFLDFLGGGLLGLRGCFLPFAGGGPSDVVGDGEGIESRGPASQTKTHLPLYKHFTQEDHNFTKHTKLSILEKTTKENLLTRENYWIDTLETTTPKGLNSDRRWTADGAWTWSSQKR